MKILVLSVGAPDRKRFGALLDDYASRIRRFGVELDERHVPEVEPGGRYSDAHVREREATALRRALPERGRVVALDPSGPAIDSVAFATRLAAWSTPLAVFVLGGPLGLDPSFVDEADATLSLSAMTLPHDLARVVLYEQTFRALTIQRGVPYHK